MPPLLPGDTVSPPTGIADLSCSLGRSPSPTSGRAACGSEVLWSSGSDGCPSELQSPLCTCGVSLASPASLPHASSSSALESSPTRDGLVWFSPSCKRCKGLAAFGRSGGKLCPSCMVLYGPLSVLMVQVHPPSSCVCLDQHHCRRRLNLTFCRGLGRHLWTRLQSSWSLWSHPLAPVLRCQRCPHLHKLLALGPSVHVSFGSW